MGGSGDTWLAQREKIRRVFGDVKGVDGSAALEMLRISATNRFLSSPRQVQLLILLRLQKAMVLAAAKEPDAWKWIGEVVDYIEDHQLTLMGRSRSDYKEVEGFVAKAFAGEKKAGGFLSGLLGRGGDGDA